MNPQRRQQAFLLGLILVNAIVPVRSSGLLFFLVGLTALVTLILRQQLAFRPMLIKAATAEAFIISVMLLKIATSEDLVQLLLYFVKLQTSLWLLLILTQILRLEDILNWGRRWPLFAPLFFATALLLRYLDVLYNESQRLLRARQARVFRHEKTFRWQILAGALGELYFRAEKRSERVTAAMAARGGFDATS